MKRLNKYTLLFFLVVSVIMYASVKVIESESFSNFAVSSISKHLLPHAEFKISFKGMDVGFFPPSTTFHQVDFQSPPMDGVSIKSSLATLKMTFSLWDFLSQKISINELSFGDGYLSIKNNQTRKSSLVKESSLTPKFREQILAKSFQKIDMFINRSKKFNLRKIILANVRLNSGEISLLSNLSIISSFNNSFDLKLNIENVKINESSGVILDQLNAHFLIDSYSLKLFKFSGMHHLDKLELNGEVAKEGKIDGNIRFRGFNAISKYLPPKLQLKGFVDLNAKVNGSLNSVKGSTVVDVTSLKSRYFNADKFFTRFDFNEEKINVRELIAKKDGGTLKTTTEIELDKQSLKKISFENIGLNINNYYSKDLLYFLPSLNPLKFYLTGDLKLNIDKDLVEVSVGPEASIQNLRLVAGEKNIIKNDNVKIGGSRFGFSFREEKIFIRLNSKFQTSTLNINGTISEKLMDLNSSKAYVEFEEFGPIVDFPIKGLFDGQVSVSGSLKDPILNLDGAHSNLSIPKIMFGNGQNSISYKLNGGVLEFKKFSSQFESIVFSGNGRIDFTNKKSPLDINFKIKNGLFSDVENMLPLVFEPMQANLDEFEASVNVEGQLKGGFELNDLLLRSEIKARNLSIYKEDFQSLDLNLNLTKSLIGFKNIKLAKISSAITGNLSYSIFEKSFDYLINITGTRLSDFQYYRYLNMGLDGEVIGTAEGKGKIENFSSNLKLNLKNSHIGNISIADSTLTLKYFNQSLFSEFTVLNDIKGQVLLDFNESSEKNSSFSVDFVSSDPHVFLGSFSRHNAVNKGLSGKIDIKLDGDFSIDEPLAGNYALNLKELFLNKNGQVLRSIPNQRLQIINGEIVNKIIKSQDNSDNNFLLSLQGDLRKDFILSSNVNVDASFLEFISPHIIKAQGILSSKFLLKKDKGKFENYFQGYSENVNLNLKNIPGQIKDVSFQFIADKNNWIIQDVRAIYGNGVASGSGLITMKLPYPLIDLKLNIKDSQVRFLKKSSTVANGQLLFAGAAPPYKLTGTFSLSNTKMYDEFNEIQKQRNIDQSYEKYLPQNSTDVVRDLALVDIDVLLNSPLRIKNSLADLLFRGKAKITGAIHNPHTRSTLQVLQGESKFKFKGHEFVLNDGEFNIDNKLKEINPYLKFSGSTSINDYKIFLGINGRSNNLPLELSSEPPLPKEDVLSLLALGYTSDISKSLGENDKRSVTTIGLGTLLVDQFKINENLSNSLGVRLSVAPEFSSEDNTLVQGKDATVNTTSQKVKTATKVKVQKKLGSKVDWSLSSTVGGSLEAKQQMNVNYNMSQEFSLEGVYERKASDINSEDEPDSVGIDIKWRNTFK